GEPADAAGGVAREPADLLAAGEVVEVDGVAGVALIAGGGDGGAVGGEADGAGERRRPRPLVQLPGAGDVPDADGLVAPAGGEELAVGGEVDVGDAAGVGADRPRRGWLVGPG